MESLAPILALWTDRFRSLSRGARTLVVVLLAVGVLATGWTLGTSSPREVVYLMQGKPLPSEQLSAMESAFAKSGLNDYVVEGSRVRVPRDQRQRYMAALAGADLLPADPGKHLDATHPLGNLLETNQQKEERIKSARQRELSQIIRSMKGIETAMVMYDSHTKPGLRQQEILTASVSVRPSGDGQLSHQQVRTIRNLVASAIAGLQPDQIMVTDLNGGRSFAPGDQVSPEASAAALAETKHRNETAWAAKVREGLEWVPGLLVTVDVTMVRDAFSASPEGTATVGWKPGRVKVALAVPNRYIEQTWRQRYQLPAGENAPAPPAEEFERLKNQTAIKLKQHVANLLPRTPGQTDTLQDVQLTFFSNVAAAPAIDAESQAGTTRDWDITPWGLAALSLLAIVGLLSLRRARLSLRQSPAVDVLAAERDPVDALESTSQATDFDSTSSPPSRPMQEDVSHSTRSWVANPAHDDRPTLPVTNVRSTPTVSTPRQPTPGRFVPSDQVPGIELNDLTTARLAAAVTVEKSQDTSSVAQRPFAFATDVGADEMAQLLTHESAQIVAIVFSYLPTEQSAEVLRKLPAALRIDVIRRLSCLDEMNDDVIREIVEGLESRLADQLRQMERKKTGMKAIQNLLDAAGDETKNEVLHQLRQRNVGLYRQLDPDAQTRPEIDPSPRRSTVSIGRQAAVAAADVITFEDVIRLDDETLRTVMDAADPQVAIQALAGATRGVVDRLAQKMKPNEADRLRLALEQSRRTSLRDMQESQRRVVDVATKLEAAGRIQIRNASQGPLSV